ncbi:MAG: hypothetical protein ACI4MC_04475, partial [Candidatus Coproplasma sp.]
NCRQITIRNSFIHSFDDSITVKGIDRYAFENNEDMLFERCVLWCDWGRTCEIGLETACAEYRNITFRDCDVLRGGNTVCDIQNGDYAEVHGITFENIRIELEGFYTQAVLQRDQSQTYQAFDSLEAAEVVCIANPRFRETYSFLNIQSCEIERNKRYAGVHDIKIKDVCVYADEKVLTVKGDKCVSVIIKNTVQNAEFTNISIENISLNGKKLSAEEMNVEISGCGKDCVKIY